jgi:ferrous iron transport protein A
LSCDWEHHPLTNTPARELPADTRAPIRLGEARKGMRGIVIGVAVDAGDAPSSLSPDELERRLLEMGFVEGARIALLHEGAFGRDPIAVQLDDMKVALRRREARCVWVRPS